MKLKKLLSLGLAVAMTVSALAGCGNSEVKESSTPSSEKSSESASAQESSSEEASSEESKEITFPLEETRTITALTVKPNTDTYNGDGNQCIIGLKEYANFEIEFTEIPNTEYTEKATLMLDSGDYPEIIFKPGYFIDTQGYGEDGILIPLEDMIREYMPALSAELDARNAWNGLKDANGHIWTLPNLLKPEGTNSGCTWINKRWLDNLGLEVPTNMDEFYEAMKAFKEQDANGNGDPNDEVPISAAYGLGGVFYHLLDDGIHFDDYKVIKDGTVKFYPYSEDYKENYLKYLAKMWEEGLIDKNLYTWDQSACTAFVQSGDYVGCLISSSVLLFNPDTIYDYVAVYPFNNSEYPLRNGIDAGGLAITDKCEDPEVILAAFDYLYTEEGARLARFGREGISFEYTNGGETYKYIYEENGMTAYNVMISGYCAAPYKMPDLYYLGNEAPDYDYFEDWRHDPEYGAYSQNPYVLPVLSFTEEEDEILAVKLSEINGYVGNYEAQVITGELSLEDSWDEFQETLKAMGVEDVEAVFQAAYARIMAE